MYLERLMAYYGIFWPSYDHTPQGLAPEHQGKKIKESVKFSMTVLQTQM